METITVETKSVLDVISLALDELSIRCVDAKIRPFDVVLFKGKDIIGKIINFLENVRSKILKEDTSQFSDVGMIVNRDVLPILADADNRRNTTLSLPDGTKHLYVWKSGITVPQISVGGKDLIPSELTIKDAVTCKTVISGSTICYLDDIIRVYGKENIFHMQFEKNLNPLDKYLMKDIIAITTRIYGKYLGTGIEWNPLRLAFMCFPGIYDKVKTLFNKNKCTTAVCLCTDKMVVDDDAVISPELITDILVSFKLLVRTPSQTLINDITNIEKKENIFTDPIKLE